MERLFEPDRHEPLSETPWDEVRVRDAIERIVAATEAAFDAADLWPTHSLDAEHRELSRVCNVYYGAAGVLIALNALARRGVVRLRRDWAGAARELPAVYAGTAAGGGKGHPGFLLGESGVLYAAFSLAPDRGLLDRLFAAIERNHDAREDEFMWGSPGTLSLALALHQASGEPRFREAFARGAARLLERWIERPETGCRLWQQDLYGARAFLVGAVHGLAGNLVPLLRGLELLPAAKREGVLHDAARSVGATAVRADGCANWPQSVIDHRPGRTAALVQVCHGAPGVLCALRDFPAGRDPALESLLLQGAELVWRAGPLRKGGGICHGTGGNGYALLEAWRRTGDARWLERARQFAMHAVTQCEAHRDRYGRYRYSLWTGDLGLAVFLADCVDGGGGVPTFTAW